MWSGHIQFIYYVLANPLLLEMTRTISIGLQQAGLSSL